MIRNIQSILACVLIGGAAVATLSACGDATERARDAHLVVVTTATSNEPQAAYPAALDRLVTIAAQTGEGSMQILVSRGARVDSVGAPVDLVIRRESGDIENDPAEIATRLPALLNTISSRLSNVASNAPTLDLLAGLNESVRRDAGTIVAMSSGLQTEGLMDFAAIGWDFSNAEEIQKLREGGFLPDLSGRRVFFAGLGRVAGQQPALPEPMIRKLESFWMDLCAAGNADKCEVVDSGEATMPAASTVPAKIVTVPSFALPEFSRDTHQISLDSSALFGPDSAELLPGVIGELNTLARRLTSLGSAVDLTGHTWRVGPAEGARELSTSRAQAVADALVSGGLHRSKIRTVRGVGYDEITTPPNAGPDEMAQANRAVIIEIVR